MRNTNELEYGLTSESHLCECAWGAVFLVYKDGKFYPIPMNQSIIGENTVGLMRWLNSTAYSLMKAYFERNGAEAYQYSWEDGEYRILANIHNGFVYVTAWEDYWFDKYGYLKPTIELHDAMKAYHNGKCDCDVA